MVRIAATPLMNILMHKLGEILGRSGALDP
jgi:hypothetical protein